MQSLCDASHVVTACESVAPLHSHTSPFNSQGTEPMAAARSVRRQTQKGKRSVSCGAEDSISDVESLLLVTQSANYRGGTSERAVEQVDLELKIGLSGGI